jgi:trehalose-6-phosphatase
MEWKSQQVVTLAYIFASTSKTWSGVYLLKKIFHVIVHLRHNTAQYVAESWIVRCET